MFLGAAGGGGGGGEGKDEGTRAPNVCFPVRSGAILAVRQYGGGWVRWRRMREEDQEKEEPIRESAAGPLTEEDCRDARGAVVVPDLVRKYRGLQAKVCKHIGMAGTKMVLYCVFCIINAAKKIFSKDCLMCLVSSIPRSRLSTSNVSKILYQTLQYAYRLLLANLVHK